MNLPIDSIQSDSTLLVILCMFYTATSNLECFQKLETDPVHIDD